MLASNARDSPAPAADWWPRIDPAGRVAVVTGAAGGVGAGIAEALVAAGADVALLDVREDELVSTARELSHSGRRAVAYTCDLTHDAAVDETVQQIRDELGPIDIVVNNAGQLLRGPPERIPPVQWARVLDVNVVGAVRVLNAVVPHMLERGSGYVVQTASMSGLYAYSYDRAPYLASKYALVGLSETLALYLAPRGVGVSCLCPGPVTTAITDRQWTIDLDAVATGSGRGLPPLERRSPRWVGDLVVAGMREGTYLLLTHPELVDELRRRADDMDAFVAAMARRLHADAPGP